MPRSRRTPSCAVAQPLDPVRRARRLHVDDRQAVRDDVVQFAGDAIALLDEHASLLLGGRMRAFAEELGADQPALGDAAARIAQRECRDGRRP